MLIFLGFEFCEDGERGFKRDEEKELWDQFETKKSYETKILTFFDFS